MLLTLRLPNNSSLKDKRSVIRRITNRTRDIFDVAIAEVGMMDNQKSAEIGIACVSNDTRHSHTVLMKIRDFVEQLHIDAEIINIETEDIHTL